MIIRRIWFIAWVLVLSGCAGAPAVVMKDRKAPLIDDAVMVEFKQCVHYLNQQAYDRAIDILDNLVKKESRFSAPFVNLGMALSRTGKLERAVQAFQQALQLDAANAKANNELGLLYRKLGRFQKARNAYETALTKHPAYLPAIRNLGILCDIYLRDYRCAMDQFQRYRVHSPHNTEIEIWIADLKIRGGGKP